MERQWTTLLWSRMGPHGPMALLGIQEVSRVPKYFFLHRLKWKVPYGLAYFHLFCTNKFGTMGIIHVPHYSVVLRT